MQDLAKQLEAVRRRSRGLLVLQWVGRGLIGLIVAFMVLGLVDYLLRLPGWLRLVVGLGVVAFGGWWWLRGVARAVSFWPTLDELALRVEALYPRLAGSLGSALAFGLEPGRYAAPAGTAAMTRQSIARAEAQLSGVHVGRVIDYRPSRRVALYTGLAVLGLAGVLVALPMHASIAAQRWVAPLGDAAWPRWTGVAGGAVEAVRPVDTPITFDAAVTRGHEPGMRVWVYWRVVGPAGTGAAGGVGGGSPESMLLTEQAGDGSDPAEAGRYRGQWRPPTEVVRAVQADAAGATLEYWFEAGDDRTEPRQTTLVARPAVVSLDARVDPPAYAAGLVPPQAVALRDAAGRVASLPALEGSEIELRLELNKPLPAEALEPAQLVPGLAGLPSLSVAADGEGAVVVGFTLGETVQTAVRLVDEHGLADASDRQLRFEALEDQPPTVTITEPVADLSVLPGAVVETAARAGDDVGLQRLTLSVEHPVRQASASPDTATRTTLDEATARQTRLDAAATLDLAPLNLQPGDEAVLHAVAADVFELSGRSHDSVEATVRRLRIIDEGTLIDQVRAELAGVRQQAVRLERQQAELNLRLEEDDPATLAGAQSRLTRTVQSQAERLDEIARRLEANRLDEPSLDELVRQADALVARASGASEAAEAGLREAAERAGSSPEAEAASDEARAEARREQDEAQEALGELARLLDQGRDALGLKLDLARLRTEQENLAREVRELLPRTAGRDAAELDDDVKEALEELARRQGELAEQAEAAVGQMQDAAERMGQQGESDAERAAAAALAEAAAVAQRQGLTQQMQQAQEATQENQLSQAGDAQQRSLDTLQQMMQEMGEQDELRQELLRRRLLELAQKLERLIAAQRAELTALEAAEGQRVPGLSEGQQRVWVLTVAAQAEAEADEQSAAVAPLIGRATTAQAAAITALREADRPAADRQERVALEALESALAAVREQQDEAEQDDAQQQRDELRQAYVALAERQAGLVSEVAELAGGGEMSRRERAALRGVGQNQAGVRDAAAELGGRVDQTLVFKRAHRLINEAGSRAADELNRGEAGPGVDADQRRVQALLESMAAALDDQGKKPEFAEQQGEAGEGGGGSGGQPTPLVPPVAELKLLRGVQQAVYDETRRAAEGEAVTPDRLRDLAEQQRELESLGRQLIEQMTQQRETMTPGG